MYLKEENLPKQAIEYASDLVVDRTEEFDICLNLKLTHATKLANLVLPNCLMVGLNAEPSHPP